jgi:hypothetical protein
MSFRRKKSGDSRRAPGAHAGPKCCSKASARSCGVCSRRSWCETSTVCTAGPKGPRAPIIVASIAVLLVGERWRFGVVTHASTAPVRRDRGVLRMNPPAFSTSRSSRRRARGGDWGHLISEMGLSRREVSLLMQTAWPRSISAAGRLDSDEHPTTEVIIQHMTYRRDENGNIDHRKTPAATIRPRLPPRPRRSRTTRWTDGPVLGPAACAAGPWGQCGFFPELPGDDGRPDQGRLAG